MSEEFRPVLLEDFPIEWPGFCIRRVALNQHMPRVEKFSEHRHGENQALLYLRGYGTQHLAGQTIPVQRGSLVAIPSGVTHRFEKIGHRRPVCLAIDFRSPEALDWRSETQMQPVYLTEIEARLVDLNEEESKQEKSPVRIASLILQIFETVERTAKGDRDPENTGPVSAAVRRVITRSGLENLTPGKIAASLDRSLDHLNRQLRAECGMTLGELLNRARLDRCCGILRDTDVPMGEVASSIGIDDQNYFSRWFRQHTGQTPTGWRSAVQ